MQKVVAVWGGVVGGGGSGKHIPGQDRFTAGTLTKAALSGLWQWEWRSTHTHTKEAGVGSVAIAIILRLINNKVGQE